jgi:ATP-dependent RNA helicase HelY
VAPAERASLLSALRFESRGRDDIAPPRLPTGQVGTTLAAMTRLWGELTGIEHGHGLSFLREPDFGFAWASHAWASGQPLYRVLGAEMTPGDFVRAVKQLIDLLDQIRGACGDGLAAGRAMRSAPCAARRGLQLGVARPGDDPWNPRVLARGHPNPAIMRCARRVRGGR